MKRTPRECIGRSNRRPETNTPKSFKKKHYVPQAPAKLKSPRPALRSCAHLRRPPIRQPTNTDFSAEEKERNRGKALRGWNEFFRQVNASATKGIDHISFRKALYFMNFNISNEEADRVFNIIDKDGSGAVDVKEFLIGIRYDEAPVDPNAISVLPYGIKRKHSVKNSSIPVSTRPEFSEIRRDLGNVASNQADLSSLENATFLSSLNDELEYSSKFPSNNIVLARLFRNLDKENRDYVTRDDIYQYFNVTCPSGRGTKNEKLADLCDLNRDNKVQLPDFKKVLSKIQHPSKATADVWNPRSARSDIPHRPDSSNESNRKQNYQDILKIVSTRSHVHREKIVRPPRTDTRCLTAPSRASSQVESAKITTFSNPTITRGSGVADFPFHSPKSSTPRQAVRVKPHPTRPSSAFAAMKSFFY